LRDQVAERFVEMVDVISQLRSRRLWAVVVLATRHFASADIGVFGSGPRTLDGERLTQRLARASQERPRRIVRNVQGLGQLESGQVAYFGEQQGLALAVGQVARARSISRTTCCAGRFLRPTRQRRGSRRSME
jgi:hypothetical protein